jgi:hypothetical protein
MAATMKSARVLPCLIVVLSIVLYLFWRFAILLHNTRVAEKCSEKSV